MNEVSTSGRVIAPAEPSRALRWALDRAMEPPGEVVGERYVALEPDGLAEARGRLHALRTGCKPVQRDAIQAWLYHLARGLAYVPKGAKLEEQVEAIILVVGDYPTLLFTVATLRDAARVVENLAVVEVVRFLDPLRERLLREIGALEALIERTTRPPPAPPAPPPPLTDEDRQRILEEFRPKVAAAIAEGRVANTVASAEVRPAPRHLSAAALLASYDQIVAAGGPAAGPAAWRANTLRALLAGKDPAK